MDDSQNSSKPIIVNDLDLILRSDLNDYQHMYKTGKKGEAMAAVVEFDSLLFDENGEVEDVGKVAKKELEDEGVEEENENTVTLYSVDSENENNEEEKIGACTSHVKDSKATLLPRSFPTRPKNCIHHIIPFSLFTDDFVKRFPSNLYVKRKLMEKHGEPKNNLHYNFRRTPSDGGEGAG